MSSDSFAKLLASSAITLDGQEREVAAWGRSREGEQVPERQEGEIRQLHRVNRQLQHKERICVHWRAGSCVCLQSAFIGNCVSMQLSAAAIAASSSNDTLCVSLCCHVVHCYGLALSL